MLAPVPTAILSLLTLSSPERRVAGSVLLRRGDTTAAAWYLESGRVIFGISGTPGNRDELLEHELGQMQGPGWVDPTAAVLEMPAAMDVVAQTMWCCAASPCPSFRPLWLPTASSAPPC